MMHYAEKENSKSSEQDIVQTVSQPTRANTSHPIQRRQRGLPDRLRAGVEALSGLPMGDVEVHYNSPKPAQVNALAYAQGAQIHLGQGQERHLPHEAWHVVQQKQGRVQPNFELNGFAVNDNKGLEREAEVLGDKASRHHTTRQFRQQGGYKKDEGTHLSNPLKGRAKHSPVQKSIIQRAPVSANVLNVIGETHDESEKIEDIEKKYLKSKTGSSNYWDETDFRVGKEELKHTLYRDTRTKGDPTWLHVQSLLAGASDFINNWFNQPNSPLTLVTYNNVFGWAWHTSMKNFMWDIGKFIQTGYFDLTNQQIDAFANNRNLFDAADQHFETLKEAVKQQDMTNRLNLIKNARDALRAFINAVYGNIRTMAQVTADRDNHMHQSANQEHQTKGAWKVGQAHAAVLANNVAFPNKNYNVTQESEFETELIGAGYENDMLNAGYVKIANR